MHGQNHIKQTEVLQQNITKIAKWPASKEELITKYQTFSVLSK
jgi:hypothetical protein